LTKPYAQSAWVHAAVKHIGQPLAAAPFNLYETMDPDAEPIESDELREFWVQPAKNAGGWTLKPEFIFETAGWLLLRGNAFWLKDETWEGQGTRNPLILADPAHMTPIHDGTVLEGWRYQSGKASIAFLPCEQVQQMKLWSPYNCWWGLAPMEAASMAAQSDYEAGRFARDLMINNGDQGEIISVESNTPNGRQSIGEEEQKRIIAALRDKKARAAKGDFRPIVIGADVRVSEPSLRAVDSAYGDQRVANREEIYTAFGIPISFATESPSYSIGAASDYFKFLELTVTPFSAVIAAALAQTSQEYEEGLTVKDNFRLRYRAEFDFSGHSTVQSVRNERMGAAGELHDRGIPWSELNRSMALGLADDFNGYDVAYLPFAMRPVEEDEDEQIEDAPPPPAEDPVRQAFRARRTKEPAKVEERADDDRNAEWEQLHAPRVPWEKALAKRFNRFLMDARAETLRNIQEDYEPATEGKALETRISSLDLIFSLGDWLQPFVRGMSQITAEAIIKAAEELWLDLDQEPLEDGQAYVAPQSVRQAVNDRQNKMVGVGTDVWERIRKDLDEGIVAGESKRELSARIRDEFNDISQGRAEVVATTETTFAYETGRQSTMKRAGVEFKEWIDSGDSRVRDSHRHADGQIVGVDEPFTVGSAQLMFPGDPNGPPEEVINCRCVSAASFGPATD
ncbi:MAG: phage portal protein, partial [Longimicrobiales bacterium]